MKNIQKIKITALLLFLLSSFLMLNAQIETVNGFNYYDINKDAFTNTTNCTSLTAEELLERQYFFTSFELAKKLKTVFNNGSDTIDEIVGDYIIHKRPFLNKPLGGEKFRWFLIRPNDNIERPVVHITHGGKNGGASELRVLSLGVYDYVQRGYAVVFYQSGSATGNKMQALQDAGMSDNCYDPSLYCSNWSPDCDIDCFQQAVYLKSQFTIAALKYSALNKTTFNLNTNLFYAIGYSGGAVGTLTAALANNNNFTHSMFSNMGSLNNLSIDSTASYNLKAIKTLAGGVLDESSENYKIGPLTTTNVSNTRFLMLHGQDDWAVQPETSPLIWSVPSAQLAGSQIKGTLSLKTFFDNNGVSNKAIINCSSGHTVYTHPCDFKDDVGANNTDFMEAVNGVCVEWGQPNRINSSINENLCTIGQYSEELYYVMQQIHDHSRIGAHFFHKDFPNSGPSSANDEFINNLFSTSDVSAINPVSFPYNESDDETNGHYIESTKCLQQTCSGLFFSKTGLGLDVIGDYLSIPAYDTEIFNNDFSLEIKFKAIEQVGPATLFSHVTNDILKTGFEIIINSEGALIFKKNVLGQGSIIGNIDVKDNECHFVELTREGNDFSLYIDGELQDTKSFNITFPSIPNYRIGNTFGSNKGFNGIIHNIKFWDDAREADFFMQTDISSNSSHLINEWTFSETKGQFLVSTNYSDSIFLGPTKDDFLNDPKWMKNDEMCDCNDLNTVGVNDKTSNNTIISLYPNPSEGSFNIFNNSLQEMQVTILDILGKEVLKTVITDNQNKIKIKEKGIYLVKVQIGIQTKTLKLILK